MSREQVVLMGLTDLLSSLLGGGPDDTEQDVVKQAAPVEGFRAEVNDVYEISGIGTVVTVRVESGQLIRGAAVEVRSSDAAGTVEAIEKHHEEVEQVEAGDHPVLEVPGLDAADVEPGDTLRRAG